ncbi:hypothetical protein Lepto7375DRAFT_6646 [Leptolyngbya sp. PCC 7375]|nr:hypothetical protein Lepto7375DRAFT_6646 [Leptolyngbya sp. PCC 7375]
MSTLRITELNPEISFLLKCARVYLNIDDPCKINQLIQQTSLNWDEVIKMAQVHRVLPILHKTLTLVSPQELPDFVLPKLHQLHFKNIKRNFFLLQELIRFLDILKKHQIDAITFKGPMTAMVAYGDLSLRTFYDLDLLVHSHDFFKLRDIAKNHGYTCDLLMAKEERECLAKLSFQDQELYFNSQKEYSLVNVKNRIFLDIHQGVLSKQFSPLFNTQWIWEHTQQVKIGGHQVLGLTPEVQILVLCAQGVEDCWNHLGKLFDVAILIKNQPDLDWDKLVKLSKQMDVFPRLLLGLCLIRQLYGFTLPDQIEQQLQNCAFIQKLAEALQQQIILKSNINSKSKLDLLNAAYQLRLMSQWKNRIKFILTLMQPTLADIATVSLPKSLFFIYYLLRPFRVMQLSK